MKGWTNAAVFILAVTASLTGCNTAPMRVPGLSLPFPETAPGVRAAQQSLEPILIERTVDRRGEHLGEDVAGTGWQACTTDTFFAEGEMPALVDARIKEAIDRARMFATDAAPGGKAGWSLASEVHVFCSQTRGFIGRRIAGLAAINFTLKHGGDVVWQRRIEHVVTDNDPEYSGSFVTTVEQGMRRTMADSLRLVLRDAMKEIEQKVARL